MRIGPLLSLVLIVAVASALWWLQILRGEQPMDTADPTRLHAPETYFEAFTARVYDREGPPRHTLAGTRMTRYTDDSTSEIEAPRLHYRDPDGPPWYLVSAVGRIGPDNERIDLEGRVVATRDPASLDLLVMRTERLTVFTADSRAETDAAVEVVDTGSRVRAIGMTARLVTGLIELHQEVRARHEPAATH